MSHVVSLNQEGVNRHQMAVRLGVAQDTIRRVCKLVLVELGISVPKQIYNSARTIAPEVVKLHQSGLSFTEIGRKTGACLKTVQKAWRIGKAKPKSNDSLS